MCLSGKSVDFNCDIVFLLGEGEKCWHDIDTFEVKW